ncbi:MAG TPA: glycosyltransferase family 87 protein [Solirubrobacterales bacterium]|nr:glycosyltransferase family 87 protein [Solirubrobacterales bacterium]
MSSFYSRHKLWVWAIGWVLTRTLIAAQVGVFNHGGGHSFEDVLLYESWSDNELAGEGQLPWGELWQYPPGAAFLLLVPRLGLGVMSFGNSFVATMLLFDLVGFALIAWLARRERRDAGVWVWLLAMPMLHAVPVLRFDLAATTLAIAALVVIHRRPNWVGALAGLGAMLKVWPIVVLFGEWDWRRLLRSCIVAAMTVGLVFALSAIAFKGDQLEFLHQQDNRGLQIEAVTSFPWHLRDVFTGEAPNAVARFGATEIASGPADTVADLLKWAALAVLVAAAAWWAARAQAIRDGREDLADAVVSRDFVFTVVLLLVITSRVLSPQYMIWLFGLSAVTLAEARSRVSRPAWFVIGAAILTTAAYGPQGAWGPPPIYSSFNMAIRNLALLVAAADASLAMYWLLRRRPASEEVQPPSDDRESAAAAPATAPR